tara:strand:- start:336 stop:506 length:171 start_codon:yes stop_codon:yes gene_type:complete
MSKTTLLVIIYVIGIIIGAIFLGLWSAETGPKALIGVIWTALFLIGLFYIEQNKNK